VQTKLTLRMDDRLIADAKAWAHEHDTSLSELVASYLARLTKPERDHELSPWMQGLIGVARGADERPPTDEEVRELYTDYLEQKYK
jgi:hypothetical protein